ncbi:hypothetical protein [Acinetobacter sp. FDAARGOS_495]|uniref:hypothetical protein n=1 Tax=Acinetobacter sp. FDAARGOS_495 TaxID=2420302 RepID=UPI002265C7AC|nr:hypothetical protein [Acinetobacter sp. FDAARGOS_495]
MHVHESQTHREMSSGLSSPVGLKWYRRRLTVATNAMQSVNMAIVLSLNEDGQVSIINTKGNPYAHVVLRAVMVNQTTMLALCRSRKRFSESKSEQQNYDDASHANSNKDPYYSRCS